MKREDIYGVYAENLKGEYKVAYEEIDGLLSFMSGAFNPLGSNMSEVVDMLLVAQKEEKPVSSVIGDDVYTFCCGIISGTKLSVKERVIQYVIRIRFLMIGFLIMSIMRVTFPVEEDSISIIVAGLYASIIYMSTEYLFSCLAFKLGKHVGGKRKLFFCINSGLQVVICCALILGVSQIPVLMQIAKLVPPQVDILLLTVFSVFAIWYKYKRKKVASVEEDLEIVDLIFSDEFDEKICDDLQKTYDKYLKRHTKKEKEILDFVSWDEKQLKQFMIIDKWGGVFYGVIILLLLSVSICITDFASALDLIIFVGARVLMAGVLWDVYNRFYKKLYWTRLRVHKKILEASVEE